VLELGCGAGDLSVELVRRGARLTALDISPRMVELARDRVPEARVLVAPAEDTGLADGSFDRVVGKWVLHHVEVDAAAREVRRLLRPGGVAVFFENQDRNPLLRVARRRLWGSRGFHWVGTRDERALTRENLDMLARTFGAVRLSYPSFYFFEALSRALGHRCHGPLRRVDALIWRRLPRLRRWSWHVLIVAVVLAGCGGDDNPKEALPKAPQTMRVSSTAFDDGGTIPKKFTCDGEGVSPPLAFGDVPPDASELALVVEDPDADRFVHWTVLGIPPDTTALREGSVPAGAIQTENGFGDKGWGGPCPPEGDKPHRYVFALYALDTPLDLESDASADEVREAIAGAAMARGMLTGRFGR
jgi:Raf kinase inhibitor-like YbhB/YbcL family protein